MGEALLAGARPGGLTEKGKESRVSCKADCEKEQSCSRILVSSNGAHMRAVERIPFFKLSTRPGTRLRQLKPLSPENITAFPPLIHHHEKSFRNSFEILNSFLQQLVVGWGWGTPALTGPS